MKPVPLSSQTEAKGYPEKYEERYLPGGGSITSE